jgi:hypothetical protein
MSKRANGRESKKNCPTTEQSAPPLLSEELIAQLQGAVSAAQRKRSQGLTNDALGQGVLRRSSDGASGSTAK